jgi:DNA-binding NarL/FixJ family response regulator
MLGGVHAVRVEAAHRLGDPREAGRALDRALAAFGTGPLPLVRLPYLARGRAWAAMAEGDARRAQQILLDAAGRLASLPLYAAQLHHEALRVGAAAAPMVRTLTALRARCDATLAELYVRHVRARADGDAAGLLRCTDDFARLDALRYAAECAAEAAEVLAAQGRTDSARRAAGRSRQLHERGQGGTAPPIRGVAGTGLRLTRRESQVAELAAEGLTNAQIGERLTVSVRTVESHLHRAMQKHGVRSRRELRDRR